MSTPVYAAGIPEGVWNVRVVGGQKLTQQIPSTHFLVQPSFQGHPKARAHFPKRQKLAEITQPKVGSQGILLLAARGRQKGRICQSMAGVATREMDKEERQSGQASSSGAPVQPTHLLVSLLSYQWLSS
jgi:hypothetical protein